MKYILDENDNVIPCEDVTKWGRWFEENRIRRILCRTHITPDIYVSTVFLCLDHGLGRPVDKPVLWETMVVGIKDEEYEGYERYTSRKDAIRGHLDMVDRVRHSLKVDSDMTLCAIECGSVKISTTEDHHFQLSFSGDNIDYDDEFDTPSLPFCYIEQLKFSLDALYDTLIKLGYRDVRDKDVELPEVKITGM